MAKIYKKRIVPKMHSFPILGFTLIELLIAITIIGILTSIAMPAYQNYTRKAHYVEVVQGAGPYKLGVEECFQVTGDLVNCKSGVNGVPQDVPEGQGVGLISSITTADKGVVTVVPRDLYGIKRQDDYILTPSIQNNGLIWGSSGGGVEKGYAK